MSISFVGPGSGWVGAGGSTRDVLRAKLRIELHDEDAANYRWTDAVLDRHLDRAVRELSLVLPREVKSYLTAAASREVGMASFTDLVRVEAVEYPVGEWPPRFVQFQTFGQVLTLEVEDPPVAGDQVAVYWGQLHQVDQFSSTLPSAAEDAVLTGAAGYAALEWASFATNRANVAGPGIVEQYAAWGEAQLDRFRELLRNFGARARVRSRRLFSPAHEPSANIVRWEQ